MKIKMPAPVKSLLDILHAKGFEAYIVGGCVRDFVLGRTPEDWDVTTSATTDQVKEIFHRTVDTGIAHGTVTVLIGGHGYEVTSYRKGERAAEAGSVTLAEDLGSRDFTINAMAYNEEEGLIDLYGGMQDLQRKKIVATGSAWERFGEDPLRMLRAVRFAAQLGFTIDEEIRQAIGGGKSAEEQILAAGQVVEKEKTPDAGGRPKGRFAEEKKAADDEGKENSIGGEKGLTAEQGLSEEERLTSGHGLAGRLAEVSPERICVELTKILCSDRPGRLVDAYELGLTKVFLPEFDLMMETEQSNPHHCMSVGMHTMGVVEHVPADKILRFAALFHDIAKPDVKWTDETGRDHFAGHDKVGKEKAVKIMRRLRMDKASMDRIRDLVAYHDWFFKAEPAMVRKVVSTVGVDLFPYLMQLQYADVLAQSQYKKEEKLQRVMDAYHIYEEILEEKPCLTIKELAISGKDLIEAGVPKGPEMGQLLQKALDHVLEVPEDNEREILMKFLEI